MKTMMFAPLLALILLVGCRSQPVELPHPERGATWVVNNNYLVPGADASGFPAPCPSYKMSEPPKAPTRQCSVDDAPQPLTPVSYEGMADVPVFEDECPGGVCAVPTRTMGGGNPAIVWLGLCVLTLLGACFTRKRSHAIIALIPLAMLFVGCAAMSDLGDATAGAFGIPTEGDLDALPGPDGVGVPEEVVWGGGGIVTLLSIILTNFFRNRARRKRGEPVTEADAVRPAAEGAE